MMIVSAEEAQERFEHLIDAVERGQTILIRRGTETFELRPPTLGAAATDDTINPAEADAPGEPKD
jgi:antitoxin (DNA-binding transcriptional repressor) of toxin-antitoxin stability system